MGATTASNTDLPEATDVTIQDGEKPIARSSPKAKRNEPNVITKEVPDATLSPETRDKELLPDETPKSSDVVSGNMNSVDVASANPQTHDGMKDIPGKDTESNPKDSNDVTPAKPKKGEFKTRIVGIRRQRDPRAFKCSCCSKRTMTLWELNAHFISSHRRVKCDMCDEHFNMPSSLKKHKYTHSEDKYACRSCDREFPFESQLHSHHHSHQ